MQRNKPHAFLVFVIYTVMRKPPSCYPMLEKSWNPLPSARFMTLASPLFRVMAGICIEIPAAATLSSALVCHFFSVIVFYLLWHCLVFTLMQNISVQFVAKMMRVLWLVSCKCFRTYFDVTSLLWSSFCCGCGGCPLILSVYLLNEVVSRWV